MVVGDADEIEALARTIQAAMEEAREAIQRAGGQLRNANSWQDRKHEEVCEAYEQAASVALRAIEPVDGDVVQRMFRIAQAIRDAENA